MYTLLSYRKLYRYSVICCKKKIITELIFFIVRVGVYIVSGVKFRTKSSSKIAITTNISESHLTLNDIPVPKQNALLFKARFLQTILLLITPWKSGGRGDFSAQGFFRCRCTEIFADFQGFQMMRWHSKTSCVWPITNGSQQKFLARASRDMSSIGSRGPVGCCRISSQSVLCIYLYIAIVWFWLISL